MGRDAHIRDTRARHKRAGRGLAQLLDGAMSGAEPGRGGAESEGLKVLCGLVQLFILGEGPLPDSMRELVRLLHDRTDPLRRDIPPDVWAALWPTLNALVEARRKCLETQARSSRSSEAQPQPEPQPAGPGLLRAVPVDGEGGDEC